MQEGQLLVQQGTAGQTARLAASMLSAIPNTPVSVKWGIFIVRLHWDTRITPIIAMDKNVCRVLDTSSCHKEKPPTSSSRSLAPPEDMSQCFTCETGWYTVSCLWDGAETEVFQG